MDRDRGRCAGRVDRAVGAPAAAVAEGLAAGRAEEPAAGTAAVAGIGLADGIDLVPLDNTRPPHLHAVVDCTPSFCRPERVASGDHPKYICCDQCSLLKRM